jgi:hypothetical protein
VEVMDTYYKRLRKMEKGRDASMHASACLPSGTNVSAVATGSGVGIDGNESTEDIPLLPLDEWSECVCEEDIREMVRVTAEMLLLIGISSDPDATMLVSTLQERMYNGLLLSKGGPECDQCEAVSIATPMSPDMSEGEHTHTHTKISLHTLISACLPTHIHTWACQNTIRLGALEPSTMCVGNEAPAHSHNAYDWSADICMLGLSPDMKKNERNAGGQKASSEGNTEPSCIQMFPAFDSLQETCVVNTAALLSYTRTQKAFVISALRCRYEMIGESTYPALTEAQEKAKADVQTCMSGVQACSL